jgi:hypothetical protein
VKRRPGRGRLRRSSIDLRGGKVVNCLAESTDFRGADLRGANFSGTILQHVLLDGARLEGADFVDADAESIYVLDDFVRRSQEVLRKKDARQWLFAHGAVVKDSQELNPHLGKPWYEAAREVMRTLEQRIAGTHQEEGLWHGTKTQYRSFAKDFVAYLVSKKVLLRAFKSRENLGGFGQL